MSEHFDYRLTGRAPAEELDGPAAAEAMRAQAVRGDASRSQSVRAEREERGAGYRSPQVRLGLQPSMLPLVLAVDRQAVDRQAVPVQGFRRLAHFRWPARKLLGAAAQFPRRQGRLPGRC